MKGRRDQFSFVIRADEAAAESVRRIVIEKIDDALAHLGQAQGNLAGSVHETRKRFKEVRAILRLARGGLGKRQFRLENRWFRDLARKLAAPRDAQATLQAFEKLSDEFAQEFGRSMTRRVHQRFLRARDDFAGNAEEWLATISGIRSDLRTARLRVSSWDLAGDFEMLESGFEESYRDARRALRRLDDGHSDDAVHSWRKRVKDQWYQMLILRNAWPEEIERRAASLEKLSKLLGDHHDLAVISGVIVAAAGETGESMTTRILNWITARQTRLESVALPLGAELFAGKPRRVVSEMRGQWSLWREASEIRGRRRRVPSPRAFAADSVFLNAERRTQNAQHRT